MIMLRKVEGGFPQATYTEYYVWAVETLPSIVVSSKFCFPLVSIKSACENEKALIYS